MATNMLGTLLEAALFLEEVEKLSSQSDLSSSPTNTTTSSTASSPSTASPTSSLHRLSSNARHSATAPGPAPAWTVKMSAGSPTTIVMPQGTTTGAGGMSPQTPVTSNGRSRAPGDGQVSSVVSTNQGQYPTAKAVSLSVANLPQQTAAIPLIIGQQQQSGQVGSVSISATNTKYGGGGFQHAHHQPTTTTTLLNSINQAAVLGGGVGVGPGNGFQLATTTTTLGSSHSNGAPGTVPTITGGITRIVDSSGNILHLPSGTAASATTYSTLVRVNGNGSVVGDNTTTEEQFENDSLPPSLVVISPQNLAGNNNNTANNNNGGLLGHHPHHQHHHAPTISIIPGPPAHQSALGATTSTTTGLDLSHVDFVHSTALSRIQKSSTTNASFEVTSNRSKKILVSSQQQQPPVFVSRTGSVAAVAYPGTTMDAADDMESIMKSTNLGKMQPMLANGLLGHTHPHNASSSASPSLVVGGSLHFQHAIPSGAALADKPEDLSSHLTFTTINGSLGSGESVNNLNPSNMLSKTTGTTTTLVGVTPKPVINLRDLSIDPQQLHNVQQQQAMYDLASYQKGAMTPGPATASGRRRTISNNSTGGSQRSPSSMRSGTRESHNKLEKNRRAQMRNCFEQLKKELPKGQEEKKTSNLSILSSALNYITTLKRAEKEGDHEMERLVKAKIGLQNKLSCLKREMASQLDKDPALAALVAGEIQRTVRTSESGADEASSMDGYPSNGDETDSFRGGSGSIVERSMSSPPRNMSPMVLSQLNGNKVQQLLGDQVSVEIKPRDHLSSSAASSLSSPPASMSSNTTILAVPNLSQVNHHLLATSSAAATQLPLTAINLSSATNPNNHVPQNGVLNIPASSSGQQIFTSVAGNATTTSFVASNGQQHVIMKGNGGGQLMTTTSNNGFNKGGNGLIIKEATTKFGSGDLLEPPPTKIMKLVNGMDANSQSLMSTTSQGGGAALHQHTQVLPIYSSTQNGGLRVIGHHTTTTTSAAAANNGNASHMPTSVVFSDPTAKYPQHLPSGMVISSSSLGGAALPANLSHQYLTNTINGVATGTHTTTNAAGAQVHKLLLTGMGPTMSGGYALPQMTQQQSSEMFARGGSTSLPGGAQLNLCRSSTPSITSGKGNGQAQKGGRAGAQISSLPLVNGSMTLPSSVSPANGNKGAGMVTTTKDGQQQLGWNTSAASPHSYVPFQMITTPAMLPQVVSTGKTITTATTGNSTPVPVPEPVTKGVKGKRNANGGSGAAKGAKRKNANNNNNGNVMITPQTSMEAVMKSTPPMSMAELQSVAISKGLMTTPGSGNTSMASITLTNAKPTTIK